jgi:hypothetical protein
MMDSSSYLAHKRGKKKGVLSLNAGHLKREDIVARTIARTKESGDKNKRMNDNHDGVGKPAAFHNSASRHHPSPHSAREPVHALILLAAKRAAIDEPADVVDLTASPKRWKVEKRSPRMMHVQKRLPSR